MPFATFLRRTGALRLAIEAGFFHLYASLFAVRRPERYLGAGLEKKVRGRVAQPKELTIAVWRVSRLWPGRSVCLHRALVLDWMLHRRGFASRFHYGIAPISRGFSAHAWTSLDGVVLIGAAGLGKFNEVARETAV